jgi:hypothetical protein
MDELDVVDLLWQHTLNLSNEAKMKKYYIA